MPKFTVKKSFKGAIYGVHVRDFVEGETVEIHDPDLAQVGLRNGWIESYVEQPEAKAEAPAKAPRNKAAKVAPEAKAE
jgi:hypothetical protein